EHSTASGSGESPARRRQAVCGRIADARPRPASDRGGEMSFDLERLYELLPAVYRLRDIELAERHPELLTAAEQSELQQLQALFDSKSPLTEPQFKRLQELQDKQQRGPLKSLIEVIAQQVAVLEEDLDRAYDDQFIETCVEWVVPYIGDLVGARG